MKSLKFIILILSFAAVSAAVSGCSLKFWQKPEAAPVTENNNRAEEQKNNELQGEVVATSAVDNIDISNWETYRNEEYGFEVKVPKEWSDANDFKDPLYMKVTKYKNAKDVLGSNDYAMALTRKDLETICNDINTEDKNTIIIDGAKAKLNADYFVPSGTFFYKFEFCKNKDLIELWVNLPLGPFTWPDDKEKINGLDNKIKNRTAGEGVVEVMDKFSKIISTFEFKSGDY